MPRTAAVIVSQNRLPVRLSMSVDELLPRLVRPSPPAATWVAVELLERTSRTTLT